MKVKTREMKICNAESLLKDFTFMQNIPAVPWCNTLQVKAVPLHAMEVRGGKVSIAPAHSQPRH
jgi:hypothetical protein